MEPQQRTPLLDKPAVGTPDNRLKAVFFMNLLQLCFTFISTVFKQLNREGVSAVELMLWRNAWDFCLV